MSREHIYDESEILRRIADSDQEAFNRLFARYRDRLFGYLCSITKSKETSEEIVLDVFLKIWTGRSIVMEIDNFEAFLFRVARNKALDFLRSVQRNKKRQTELWKQLRKNRVVPSCEDKLLLEDTALSIQAAVSRLSPQRKKVFQLSREHGLTYEQIANQLHLSRSTVRNHLAASLQFIRTHLDTDLTYSLLVLLSMYLLK